MFNVKKNYYLTKYNMVSFYSEDLKVNSGDLKVMTLKTNGDFCKRLYFKVI